LPIHYNVVLVGEGEKKDGIKLVMFLTSTSLRHAVLPQSLILLICETIEPTIPLEVVTHLIKSCALYLKNGVHPN